MRWFFVTLPCALFDLWWTVYRLVLTVACMVMVTLTALALLLDALGVRWGW